MKKFIIMLFTLISCNCAPIAGLSISLDEKCTGYHKLGGKLIAVEYVRKIVSKCDVFLRCSYTYVYVTKTGYFITLSNNTILNATDNSSCFKIRKL